LPGGEPLKEHLQADLPLLLLLLVPCVKRSFLAQPEAVKEGTAQQREGMLQGADQGGALRLSGDGGDLLNLQVGLLHDVQVQPERDLRVQAQQLLLTEQMAGPS
jgi:uncharacterized protein (AIM24 family)